MSKGYLALEAEHWYMAWIYHFVLDVEHWYYMAWIYHKGHNLFGFYDKSKVYLLVKKLTNFSCAVCSLVIYYRKFLIRLGEEWWTITCAPKVILGVLLLHTLDIKIARLVLIFKLQHLINIYNGWVLIYWR